MNYVRPFHFANIPENVHELLNTKYVDGKGMQGEEKVREGKF